MRKIVILAFIILSALLVIGCSSNNTSGDASLSTNKVSLPPCTDSDGGINFAEKGTTSQGSRAAIDTCIDDYSLVEYYCSNNRITSYDGSCARGLVCLDGACVEEPIAYEVDYVSEIFAPQAAYVGEMVYFNMTVINTGNGNASTDSVTTVASINSSGVPLVEYYYTPPLYSGQMWFNNSMVYCSEEGYINLTIDADYFNNVTESNEWNNYNGLLIDCLLNSTNTTNSTPLLK